MSSMQATEAKFKREALQALRKTDPVRGLSGVRIRAVKAEPEKTFDIQFELVSGKSRVGVIGEIKSAVSLKLLQDIAPWVRRMSQHSSIPLDDKNRLVVNTIF